MNISYLTVGRRARYLTLGPADAAGLWIVLHGYAQLAGRFLRWFAPLDDGTRRIVAPEALSRFYLETTLHGSHGPAVGATWLTRESRETDLEDHLDYLDLLLNQVSGESEPVPVTLLGFSQGAVMAARWLARRPVRVGRVVFWGTPLPDDVQPAELGRRLQGLPVLLACGDRDPLAPLPELERQVAALRTGGAAAEVHPYAGGHRVEADALVAAARRFEG